VCRLLFANPNGWPAPRLGVPEPTIDETVAKQWPLFPIAVSQRVPFLLLAGYRLGGRGEAAGPTLGVCEDLNLIGQDYSTSGYEDAAFALVKSTRFRKLYRAADRQDMEKMIILQAKRGGNK